MRHLEEILKKNKQDPSYAYKRGRFENTSYGLLYIPAQCSEGEGNETDPDRGNEHLKETEQKNI